MHKIFVLLSLFHASTCCEHMCSQHVETWDKLIVKQKFCASSWLITEINILRCTVSETSKKKVQSCLTETNHSLKIANCETTSFFFSTKWLNFGGKVVQYVNIFTWTYKLFSMSISLPEHTNCSVCQHLYLNIQILLGWKTGNEI